MRHVSAWLTAVFSGPFLFPPRPFFPFNVLSYHRKVWRPFFPSLSRVINGLHTRVCVFVYCVHFFSVSGLLQKREEKSRGKRKRCNCGLFYSLVCCLLLSVFCCFLLPFSLPFPSSSLSLSHVPGVNGNLSKFLGRSANFSPGLPTKNLLPFPFFRSVMDLFRSFFESRRRKALSLSFFRR